VEREGNGAIIDRYGGCFSLNVDDEETVRSGPFLVFFSVDEYEVAGFRA